jgi:hypothetical protein
VQSIKHCISILKLMGNYDMCETQGNFVLALTRCKASNCHVSIIEKVCSATEIVSETAAGRCGGPTLPSRDRAEISSPNVQANPLQTSGPYMTDENHKKVLKFHSPDPSNGQKTISSPKARLQLPVQQLPRGLATY